MADVPTIATPDMVPETFFERFILTRQPVKFSAHFQGVEWQFGKWSNQYLKTKVGSASVKIEYRDDNSGRYGEGKDQILEFRDFLDQLEAGNEKLYMTTQKLEYSAEGQPCIISEPVKGLISDIPIRPPIMGNLIPQNINMWMGCSTASSTSGLHHDFHDNVYIVLRGHKVINIFPPEEYPNMYLVGRVSKMHPNGRINYVNRLTNADGSAIGASQALRAAEQLDRAAARLDSIECESEGAEEEMESALEALLDAQMAEGIQGGDDFSGDDEDDYESLEGGGESEDSLSGHSSDGDDSSGKAGVLEQGDRGIKRILSIPAAEDCQFSAVPATKKRQIQGAVDTDRSHRNSEGVASTQAVQDGEAEESLAAGDPPSFSRVDTSLPDDVLQAQFPLFVEARSRCMKTVSLKAGQMLYLPAGWFHEVRSVGPPPEGHLAVNYWFHPPDGATFERPYTSDFWQSDWASRKSIA